MAEGETSVEFGYGTVRYNKAIEAIPATSKTTGNITINNSAQPGCPEHFLVTFMLSCGPNDRAMMSQNTFHWTEIVTGMTRSARYSEVEAKAARQLAPSLRSVADAIEKMVAEFDEKDRGNEA